MGVGEAVFYGVLTIVAAAVMTVGIAALVKVLRSRPRDLSDTLAERVQQIVQRHEVPGSNLDPVALDLAAAEAAYRTELRGAPVVGVPYDAVSADGSHDAYPHMSQHARDAVIASLNAQLSLPARERAS